MTRRTAGTARAVTLALALALALAAPAQANEPAPTPQQAAFETQFMTETVDHHFMGVQMGRTCVERTGSFRIGDICTGIAVSQLSEIEQLRMMLRRWYGTDKHPVVPTMMRPMLRRLAMTRRGFAFDLAISRGFAEHHTTQIGRSRACLTQAFHDELKDMCTGQIETQSREIRQFRTSLCLRYRRCGPLT